MGSKLAERAVVRDIGLNTAFKQGAGVEESVATGQEYRVLLYIHHRQVDEMVFAYLDGAMAWGAAHLLKGEGHTIRAECRQAAGQITGGEPVSEDDVVDAEIVE